MKRRFVRWFAIAAAVILVVCIAGSAYLLRDPLPHFLERRSSIASASEMAPVIEDGYSLIAVKLVAKSGLAVDFMVRRALADSGQIVPLAVILGGHLAGADAARVLGDTRGVAVAAVSYPFTGDPRPAATTFLREIPKIRGAFLDTPPALMLVLDYLLKLPNIDTTRVEGIGVSLGAPFMCIAGALDKRYSRVWAIHGSGGSYSPLEVSMRRTIKFAPLRWVAAGIANVIIAGPRLDPAHWVGQISPRKFAMVNATDDERMPRNKVDELYVAARDPKEIIWMPGLHVHGDRETILKLVEIVMSRVRAR